MIVVNVGDFSTIVFSVVGLIRPLIEGHCLGLTRKSINSDKITKPNYEILYISNPIINWMLVQLA